MAKAVAVGEESLPHSPAQKRGRQHFVKERRRSRRAEEGLYEWIATDPERTSIASYNAWREKRNKTLAKGEPRFLAGTSILTFWKQPWPELVADAKAGTLKPPAPKARDPFAAERSRDPLGEKGKPIEFESTSPAELVFDPELVARRHRQARAAREISFAHLAERAGVSKMTPSRIEDGTQLKRIFFRSRERGPPSVVANLVPATGARRCETPANYLRQRKRGSPRGSTRRRGEDLRLKRI